uniref:Reverse transcriptase n=1 Tax=Nicotiana tabacum TaxID=4097 RepID=A0A1S4DP22_TOBAC|nr:PREDICTED: uncharacterized protein LOC107831887 [Nicotiana tabacum]
MNTNMIFSIKDSTGTEQDQPETVAQAFIEFYTKLLGTTNRERSHVCSALIRKGEIIDEDHKQKMVKTVTKEEIKKVLWSIPEEKSPGIDGYGIQFFKDAWDIVGKDVEECVTEFFKSSKMLKALNKIVITLIPKGTHVESTAYDNVEWEFVKEMMMALNYHTTFIQWVMECITTTSYSLAINEGLCENIEGKRGLRQGDPISPLIFVICIEYLLRIMEMVRQQKGIAYHPKYKSLGSNHLCFVDDVLLFCKGESQAIMLLIRDLASFSQTSGLTTNSPKSNIFSANMSRQQIFEICFKEEGWLIPNGKYTMANDYKWRMGDEEYWQDIRWVWNLGNTPKHNYICWLTSHRKLLTMDRMKKIGIIVDTTCKVCGEKEETREHLFFECTWSKRCAKELLNWMGMQGIGESIETVWKTLNRTAKGKQCRAFVLSVFAALIYATWKNMNDVVWNQVVTKEQVICKNINEECRYKIHNKGKTSKRQME